MRAVSTETLARWLVGHPRAVLAVLLGLLGASLACLPLLRFEAGVGIFTDRSLPEQAILDRVDAAFVTDEIVFVGYEAPDVFSHEGLTRLRALCDRLGAIVVDGDTPAVDEITSLTTIDDLVGQDGGYQTLPLVPDEIPRDAAALERIRQRARHNPLIAEGLLMRDGAALPRETTAAILLRLAGDLSDEQTASLVEQVRAITADAGRSYGWILHVTGGPVFNSDTVRFMAEDLGRFIPLVYLLVTVMLYVLLRRLAGVALALLNTSLCFGVGMAALAATGGSINNLSAMMPPVMMVLSIAVVVHFLGEAARHARAGDPMAATRVTLGELLAPAFMVEVTTAVGFIALATSNIPAMRSFGLAATLAVLLSFVAAICLMVVATARYPVSTFISVAEPPLTATFGRLLERYLDLIFRRPHLVLAIGLGLAALAALGVPRVRVNEDQLSRFGESTEVRQATTFIERQLGGTMPIVVSIDAGREGAFLEPALLRRVEALEAFATSELGADSATSFADYVKLMHRAFSDEAPSAHRIPESREQVAQLVLLNGDDDVRELDEPTHAWARVVLRTRQHGTAGLEKTFARLDAYLTQHFPVADGFSSHATGQARLWVATHAGIIQSQTSSLGLAFLLIFGPIFLLFRSLSAGAFTIPSNLFPILVTYGVMGWFGIDLNTSTVMVASIVLGIAVDDTIHFVQFLRSRIAARGDIEQALRDTFGTKAVGALWIMIIITLGFSVVMTSSFAPTRDFGILTAVAMLSGIVGELVILPPLLLLTRTRLGVRRQEVEGGASRLAG